MMVANRESQVTEIRSDYVRSKQVSEKTKSRRRRKLLLRLGVFAILMVIIVSGMVSILHNEGKQLGDMQVQKSKLNTQLKTLKTNEKGLNTQIKQLHDLNYIGEIARRDYLLSKPNETIFTVSNSNKH